MELGGSFLYIEGAVVSHEGKLRAGNEDNYFLNGLFRDDIGKNRSQEIFKGGGKQFVFSVCDGMGGEEYGEIASLCSVRAMDIFLKEKWSNQTIDEFIKLAGKNMKKQLGEQETRQSATTVTVLFLEKSMAYVANLGDSRIYLFRDGKLRQLSKDHTQAQLLVENGLLKEDEARNHRDGHILTRYLGMDLEPVASDFYCLDLPLQCSDIFLLCSDGLTDMVADEEMKRCLEKWKEGEAERLAGELCSLALSAGGADNITCLVVKINQLEEKRTLLCRALGFFGKGGSL